MNRLRRWWDSHWLDALIILTGICAGAAVAMVVLLWATP